MVPIGLERMDGGVSFAFGPHANVRRQDPGVVMLG